MRKINLTLFAAGVTLVFGPNVFAADYVPGVMVVRFQDPLDINYDPSGVNTQYGSINRLNREYGVHEIGPLYPFLPTKPVDDPNGKWKWEDWEYAMKKYRLDLDYVVRYDEKYDPEDVTEAYRKDPNVIFADICWKGKWAYTPNDPDYQYQWHLPKIRAPQAWNYWPLQEQRDAVIAVLDSGVQCWEDGEYYEPHEDLEWNFHYPEGPPYWPGYNCIYPDEPPNDADGHGTKVAGVFGAVTDNLTGVAGVCFNEAEIMPVKVGSDRWPETQYVAQGIVWAALNGADVENMSFYFPYLVGPPPVALSTAVKFAYSLGVVMVASLDDEGYYNHTEYPAWYKEVIAVNATNEQDERWPNSGYGQEMEFAAPGTDIYTTTLYETHWPPEPRYGLGMGTSFACSTVSGLAGLVQAWIYWETPDPSDRIPIVRDKLKDCCVDIPPAGWDEGTGWGRVDLKNLADDLYGEGRLISGAEESPKGPLASVPTVNLAPNPARGKGVFVITVPAGAGSGEGRIDVYDLAGRKIGAQEWTYAGPGVYRVGWEYAAAPSGVYVYRVTGFQTPLNGKIVVTK